MYPKDLFLGLDLYDISICIGVIACILVFGRLADERGLRGRLQNLAYTDAIIAIVLGYASAVFMQAVYNIAEIGRFEITQSTGATFYGGLVGGAAVFLAVYFIAGHFRFEDGYHRRNFFVMADCAVPSIVIAHAFGRIGCLMAGCCHGNPTDAWFGIMMHGDMGYQKYVPVQLFEALFLFVLFAFLAYRAYKGKNYNLPLYMASYGIWRYLIEFIRGDERGGTFTSLLSPSQLTALLMIAGGVAVFFLERRYISRHAEEIRADAEAVLEARRLRKEQSASNEPEKIEETKENEGER